jgi:hypothetical protein
VTAPSHSFDRLAGVEPSFRLIRPWFGGFEVRGHFVACALEPDDWVCLSARLDGSERDLIRQQSRVPLPVRIAAGPTLIAETPLMDSLESTFVVLRSAVHRSLRLLASAADESGHDQAGEADVTARLESLVEGSAFTWERAADHIVTKAGTATIVGRAFSASIVFGTNVLHLKSCSPRSLDALTHFVLAANSRFRFVRTAFRADRLVHEVALPAAVLTASLVNHAVGAISTAFHMTKLACGALANSHIAELYLEFHTQGKDHHAHTHD